MESSQANTPGAVLDCPDCAAVGNDIGGMAPVLHHDDSCPIGQSVTPAIADRRWFAAYPAAAVRERALTWGERAWLVHLGARPAELADATMRVHQAAPGVRFRVLVAGARR